MTTIQTLGEAIQTLERIFEGLKDCQWFDYPEFPDYHSAEDPNENPAYFAAAIAYLKDLHTGVPVFGTHLEKDVVFVDPETDFIYMHASEFVRMHERGDKVQPSEPTGET